MRFRPWLALGALALALAVAGCSDDKSSPTSPAPTLSQNDADDLVQQVAANTVATNFGTFVETDQLPPGAALRMRRAMPAAAQWDTAFSTGPLNFEFTVLLYDTLGNQMTRFKPDTTWRLVETSRITGSVALANYLSSMEHNGTLTLTGMRAQDDTATFNGTALDTAYSVFQSSIRSVTRYFHISTTRTIANVRVPKAADADPTSGTITWVVTAQRLRSSSRGDVEATLNATIVLTFNGTPFPTITVTGGWRYRLDLDTGAITRLTT